MLVLPGLINAHHHGMAISTVQLGFPDPGPARARPARHAVRVVDGDDARARRRRPLPRHALQGRPADRVRRHVAPAHALPLGRRRRAARGGLRRASCGRRCAPTASRASASRWRRTGATARAWPTTATRRSSRRCPADLRAQAHGALAASRMPTEAYLATIAAPRRELAGDPLLSAQFAIMAPQWASDELVAAVGSAAAELGAGIHLHALESRAAARLGRRLRRRARARAAGGRRRARRPQRARARRLAARLRHRVARPHRRDRRAQLRPRTCASPPASRRCAASSRPASASRSGSTTWASPTTTTCSPRCGSRTSLQRVHGEAEHPRLRAAEVFGLMWDGGAQGHRRRDGDRPARAGPARRRRRARPARAAARRSPSTMSTSGSSSSRAARAAHVDSVIVEGRVLMQGGRLQHLDRDALMAEVAGGGGSRRSRGASPRSAPGSTQLGRRIAEHYQAPRLARPEGSRADSTADPSDPAPGCASLAP